VKAGVTSLGRSSCDKGSVCLFFWLEKCSCLFFKDGLLLAEDLDPERTLIGK
jgi:hypothetical protein